MVYYQLDHLGTPIAAHNAKGEAVWTAEYEAWGRIRKETVSDGLKANIPFRFQGQYYDEESGLHYNRFRYYDPEIGRFVSQDPIGLFGGMNSYEYALNPILRIDPLGLRQGGYNCPDEAAKVALGSANPKSIRLNKEYGGLIYEKGGKFFYTIPVAGKANSFKLALARPQLPNGAKVVGDYHTHGDYSRKDAKGVLRRTTKDYDTEKSDDFSVKDTRITEMARMQYPCHKSYLGTPSGKFKVNSIGGYYEL